MLTIVSVLQPLPALGCAARRPHCSLPLTLSSTGSCVLWKGDLGWAAALLSAGHLAWMFIGHKEKPGEGAWLGANGHRAGARRPLLRRGFRFCWSRAGFQVASCQPGSLLPEFIPVGRRTTCAPKLLWVFRC